jgi:hypothetical protein
MALLLPFKFNIFVPVILRNTPVVVENDLYSELTGMPNIYLISSFYILIEND